MRKIYLDNNATTSLDQGVIAAMQDVMQAMPLNPSSIHTFGQTAKQYLIRARDTLAQGLHVKPNELIFTSSATEALNFLIRGFYALSPQCHIISSDVEHPAVRLTLADLQRVGAHVTYVPAGLWGAPLPEAVHQAVQPSTGMIVLSAVNSVTGVKTDLDAIAKMAHRHNIPLIVDAVQLLGKEPLHLPRTVAGAAFSAHKIHGPQGVGACILRTDYRIPPLITGGHQEQGRRAGTENLIGIVGFAKAVELLAEVLPQAKDRMEALRNHLVNRLSQALGNLVIHGAGPKVCNTVHIGFPGEDGETLLQQLDLAGIAVSHGSACSSGGREPSPILIAMGIPHKLAQASLRFSLSRMTTQEEIDTTVDTILDLMP